MRGRRLMVYLVVLGIIVAVALLYVTDRLLKARTRVRRRRVMSHRLAAVTARAKEQQARRQAAAAASAELTSVVPAINHPVLTSPPQQAGCGPAGPASGSGPSAGPGGAGQR